MEHNLGKLALKMTDDSGGTRRDGQGAHVRIIEEKDSHNMTKQFFLYNCFQSNMMHLISLGQFV